MLTLTTALITGFAFGIVWYIHHRLTYWQRRGVPTPGILYQWKYYTSVLPNYDLELTAKYGSVFGVLEGTKPILIVSDIDMVRDVLVKDFASFPNHKPLDLGDPTMDLNMFFLKGNEDWKRIRSLISPTFTSGKLRSMEPLVNSCIAVLKKNLGVVADSGEVIDVKKYFNSLSFDVIARCAYGTKIDSLADPSNPIQKNFLSIFEQNPISFLFTMLFPRIAAVTGVKERAARPMNFFKSMTETLIDERTRAIKSDTGAGYNDFLQTMIDANREAMMTSASDHQTHSQEEKQHKKTISTEEMVAQSLLFLVAGHETTATGMAMCAYYLSTNPELQDKLIDEVSTLNECTHDSVMGLKYLEAFVKESFRLSPPAIRVERECVAPTLLGNVKIEPGTIVSIPVFAVHRDPRQYKNPDVFDPNRFIDGDSVNHNPYAYLPFGGGPRMCVAQRFALMEVKLAMAQILREYRFEVTPETNLSFKPASLDGLALNPIMMKVRRH